MKKTSTWYLIWGIICILASLFSMWVGSISIAGILGLFIGVLALYWWWRERK